PRLIVDLNSRKEISVSIGVEQLQQSLESAKRANNCRCGEQCLSARDVETITLVLSYRRNGLARTLGMDDELRHLIIRCKSRRQRQHRASFEPPHETRNARLQTSIRVPAR